MESRLAPVGQVRGRTLPWCFETRLVVDYPEVAFRVLGALSADLAIELNTLKIRVASMMTAMFGPVCAFEHGPGAAKRSVGCGVDHAHLHMVPIDFDLVAAAQTFLPPGTTWTWATWDNCREATRSGCDYLYIEQPVGNGRIAINPALGSQIFRKAIAAHLGVPEQFNWRDFPQERNILDTITAFADLPISGPGDITHSGRL